MAQEQGQAVAQPEQGALNPHQAVEALTAMIEQSETPPRDEKGKFAKPEAKQEAATPEKEATTEPAEGEVEAAETQEEEAEIKPEPRRFKLNYKGEEKEIEEQEALELAQKGYDYTQKTQALAKEREELTAARSKAEVEARKQYEDQLEIHKQAVLRLADPEALSADLNKLSMEDPAKAQQLFFKRLQIQNTLQGIANEQARIAQQRDLETQTTKAKQRDEAIEIIQREIPGWNQERYGKILKTAVDSGFTQQEANAITDPKVVKLLDKARQWDEYVAAKPKTVDKRVASVPKVQKPGTSEKSDAKSDKVTAGMARLSKTGSRQDAQDYALALIEAGKL